MIDTIKLAISTTNIKITDYSGFNISEYKLKQLIEQGNEDFVNGHAKYTKLTKSVCGYVPQISICCYSNQTPMLTLTFSAPKMASLSNNLVEIREKDYDILVNNLINVCGCMGIYLNKQAIYDSKIWTLHTCKNVLVGGNEFLDCNSILSCMHKLHFDTRLENRKTFFIDDIADINKVNYTPGQMFSLFCKSYEMVMYNKLSELRKDKYGQILIENNQNIQSGLLRLECRFFKSQDVQRIFKKVGLEPDISLGEFFKDDNFKLINLHMWNKLIKPKTAWLGLFEQDASVIIETLLNMGISGTKILELLGICFCNQTEYGLNSLSKIFPPKTKVLPRLKGVANQISQQSHNKLQLTFNHIEDTIIQNQAIIHL